MTQDISILVKSYSRDFTALERLLRSLDAYNVDSLPVTLCVPRDELAQARQKFAGGYTMLVADDDLYDGPTPSNWPGFSQGYLVQQLVKLSAYRLGTSRWYWALDSDSLFIKDFDARTLSADRGVFRTFCSEDRELLVAPWYRTYAEPRWLLQRAIADRLGLSGDIPSAHNNLIMSATALAQLEDWSTSEMRGLVSLLEIAPYEFGWYVMFLRRFLPELMSASDPLIRMVHTRSEYRSMRYQGITLEDLRRGYIGVCLNSSWSGDGRRELKRLRSRAWGAALRLRRFSS